MSIPLSQLSGSVEALVRVSYGVLLLLQLVATVPSAHRFFSSERHGGYLESSPFSDALHRPAFAIAIVAAWMLCAVGLVFDVGVLFAAALNFAFARYFYVNTRWKSILRGMGAPGHMNHWLSALILLLTVARFVDGGATLRALAVLAFRVDFAAIMVAAGIYKIASGYRRSDGFERGLVNPWWGFHARWLRNIPAHSAAFVALNHAAYFAEIACGLGFLLPPLAPYAALFLAASFLAVGLAIRLTWLAEMVAVCCLFTIPPGNTIDAFLSRLFAPAPPSGAVLAGAPAHAVVMALSAILIVYLAALPFAYAGMMWNFYGKRRLTPWLQRLLDAWTAFSGLILWRVFTADIINFFVSVELRKAQTQDVRPFFSPWSARRQLRYRHVGEFICLASIFTTLKYYPHDPALFERRLLRYARTIPKLADESITFRYVSITKGSTNFEFQTVAEFDVDPLCSAVQQRVLEVTFDPKSPAAGSPVISGSRPGSYAPVATS